MSTTIGSGQTLTAAFGETADYEIASGGTLVYDVGATLVNITLDPGATFIEVGLTLGGSAMTVAPVSSEVVIDVGAAGTTRDATGVVDTQINTGAVLDIATGGQGFALTSANAVAVTLAGGALVNQSTVTAGGTALAGGVGVYVLSGTLDNQAGALITGGVHGSFGAGVQMTGGTVSNAGTITAIADTTGAGGGPAVYMAGGNLDNTGLLAGGASTINDNNGGLGLVQAAGTLTNEGTILGGGSPLGGATGVNLDGGTLINTGLIEGGAGGDAAGIYLAGGTLITAGTIEANPTGFASNLAVLFAGADTMVVEPRATFIGAVQASSTDTIELAGTAAGTLAGFGSQITGLGTLEFDAGSDWTVAGSAPGLAAMSDIAGFRPGETIDITGVGTETGYLIGAGNVLTLTGGTATATLQLASAANEAFTLSPDGAGGTEVTPISTSDTITSAADWNAAITAADLASLASSTPIDFTFTLAPTSGTTISLDRALKAVNLGVGSSLSVIGNGDTIDGAGQYNGLFVYAGTVDIANLTIADARAAGGAGGSRGGGGAGLGGGLFVGANVSNDPGVVTLSNVGFSGDKAVGGAGVSGVGGYGGGGGMLGGQGNDKGGGGLGGNGGISNQIGGSTVTPGQPGLVPGAAGGGSKSSGNDAGSSGGASGGGGGAIGGLGGFGGGGGISGSGGFGGGGGGGNQTGPGGFGAGRGGNGAGGGGLGAGGDIFVQHGASLTIGATANTIIAAGTVTGGTGANAGSAFGNGLFIQGNQAITLTAAPGQTLTIAGGIADQNGAWFSLGNTSPDAGTSGDGTSNAGVGTLDIGAGIVALQAANTFSGPVVVQSAAEVRIAADANLGIYNVGTTVDGNVLNLLAGSTLDFAAGFTLAHPVLLSGDPTVFVGAGTLDTIASLIADGTTPGVLELTGGGTLALTDNNTYAGGTTIEGDSTLLAEAPAALGTGPLLVTAGATVADPASNTAAVTTGSAAQVVTNAGTITAGGTGFAGGVAVYVTGGTLTNQTGGVIEGGTRGSFGAGVQMTGGTVANAGTITAFADTTGAGGGPAAYIYGGSLDNTGLIAGGASVVNEANNGLGLALSAGTVTNEGTILGGGSSNGGATGVNVNTGGTLFNTGLIEGGAGGGAAGVYLDGGTLITAGTIAANPAGFASNQAVLFAGADDLVVKPGAVFIGAIQANSSDTIELAGTASATLAGFGGTITGLGTLSFDPGSDWTARGTAAGFTSGTTLAGFATTGAIDLTDLPIEPGATAFATGTTLTLDDGATTEQFTLATTATGAKFFAFADTLGTGTVISSVACYRTGTHIATAQGEAPVEHLAVGDVVRTLSGALRPIRWIGHRTIHCATHPTPAATWPVRVRTGAFGAGLPRRDVWLSPDHAVFVEDVLIPIRHLVNGASIAPEPVETVGYWHIELDCHDVLLAEGLPAESWLDTGNRSMFANAGHSVLHPDFRVTADAAWQSDACAALVEGGPVLEAIRARLSLPGEALPELELSRAGTHTTRLAPNLTTLRLVSACGRVRGDARRLGALVVGLRVDDCPLDLRDPGLGLGFHPPEWHDTGLVRWTDGAALLTLPPGHAMRTLAVDVALIIPPGQTAGSGVPVAA